MLTLSTCRKALWTYGSPAPYSTATVSDIALFDSRLNQVVERFFTLGTWRSMWKRLNLIVYGTTLTLPRGFDTIRSVQPICDVPTPIYSQFHAFSCYGCTADPYYPSCQMGLRLRDENAQTFVIPTGVYTLRATATEAANPGFTFTDGVDGDGNELFGSTNLALVNGASNGTQAYTALPSIQKVVTNGPVSLYAVDTTTSVATLIANYAPGETIPSYRQYNVGGIADGSTVQVVCKLGFVTAVAASDLVIPGNLGALKLGMQALQFEDRTDPERAGMYWGPSYPERNPGKMSGAIDLLDSELSELIEAEQQPFMVSSDYGAGNVVQVR